MWRALDDRVTLGAEIGAGAFARVRRGVVRATGTEVAIKMLRSEREATLHWAIEREADLLQNLVGGPAVIQLLAVGTLGGRRALVMQLCDGTVWEAFTRTGYIRPLRHYVGLPPATVQAVARDVTSALAYVHARQMIHADLKPENIFCGDGGTFVLGDFGSAVQCRGDRYNDYMQSRYYRAPEINLGRVRGSKTNITPAMDVWSLGCIVYELLTGQPLFAARDYAHLARMHVGCLGLPPAEMLEVAARPAIYTRYGGSARKTPLSELWSSLQGAAKASKIASPAPLPAGLSRAHEALLRRPEAAVYVNWLYTHPTFTKALCNRLAQPEVDPAAAEFVALCMQYERPSSERLRSTAEYVK